jgi:hypothetical protein
MVATFGSRDWRDAKVREWLLLTLRFAITRKPSDQSMVLAMADELDSLGVRWRPAAPSFFCRTSNEVCEAILTSSDGHSSAVLRKHVARIDDARLRRAFQAAVGFEQTSELLHRPSKGNGQQDQHPWKGPPIK